ncbi:site-specific integrase [Bacillus sp. FSL W8-0102]|uniref:tyrosine-type recombinase/integrase n=2 Tax=unclassified Bacillus (in: firmicutes) TaxID=185979 RepID=UPI0030F72A2F
MEKTRITAKSTLIEAYIDFESKKNWSKNTRRSYSNTINDVQEDMIAKGIEPILENLDYDYALTWENEMRKDNYSPKTIKQKLATMASLFSHLNKLGIINRNPFLALNVEDSNEINHHSRALSIVELYEVYKAAHELDSEGVAVLIPILLDIFTGLRSTSLKKLKVQSISEEYNGLIYKFDPKEDHVKSEKKLKKYIDNNEYNSLNRKNKNFFLPLPPKLMTILKNFIQNKRPEDPLLYGLKGKPLENKQMNYITDKVCEHLGWIKVEYENPPIIDNRSKKKKNQKKGKKIITKTEKFFTPHGFRYTIATLFHEIGVSEDSIRFLLGHSNFELRNLRHYILSDAKYIKEIRAAQTLLESLFETTMYLETNHNIKVDLDLVFQEFPNAFDKQKKYPNYVNNFTAEIIFFSLSQLRHEINKRSQTQFEDGITFKAPELNNQFQVMPQHGYVPLNNHIPFNGIYNQIPQGSSMPYSGGGYNGSLQQPIFFTHWLQNENRVGGSD